ncbi:MAG TPA: dTMP kinase [Balneola sp.]|jgi:dTMP kinase|nr:dTMP kinase [Balneola sp.]MAO78044.1 dTMP kinase [Balneola sp.]MBF64045.1 dTMP kinase [Balneola sp.]HAH50789.1 dTMP kinase [Balneola sp.]HAW79116.1 dTMP kinase [Balneola sp.]|tara:strand:+ start:4525 stop:5121 length:597 start_codon:yes stop_codon:yes gene_type:complete
MLITFEGIDGSGKSTQISLLKKYITNSGKDVEVLREPGGTDISELIRGMLLNPEIEIDPVTELLLFSSARSQLIAEKVKPLLAKDVVIILDRFYDSTTAYQGYGRGSLPIDQVHQINRVASHGIAPDITFYLRLSLEESANRTAHMEKDRMEQSGIEFYQNVIKGFDELAEKEVRFMTIDASKTVEEVHKLVLSNLPF